MKRYRHYPWFIAIILPLCWSQIACGTTSRAGQTPTATGVPMLAPSAHLYVLGNQVEALAVTNGQVIWQHTYPHDTLPHMAVTTTQVYLAADRLEALRASDGAVQWQTTQSTIGATLVAADASRVYVAVNQHLDAFRSADGHLLWTTPADDRQAPIFAADGQTVYVTTSNQIQAVTVATGAIRWTTPTAALGSLDPPVAVGDLVIAVVNATGSTESQVVAYHESAGSVAWTVMAPVGPFVAADPGHVYAVAENLQTQTNQLIAFATATGAQTWALTYPYAVSTQVDEPGSILYVNEGQGTLVAIDSATGRQIWQQQQQQNALQLLVADAHGFVAWDGGDVTAFTTAQGNTVWIYPQTAQLAAASADTLYLMANTTTLIALGAAAGTPRWQTPIATTLTGAVQVMVAP